MIRTTLCRLGLVVISMTVGLLMHMQSHAATLWTAPSYVTRWGSCGSGAGQMNAPTAITTAPNGDVLVADLLNSRVDRFSASGSSLGSWATGSAPEGVACDANGNVFVSTDNGFIEKHAPDGTLLLQWAVPSTPHGIAVDRAAGRLYATMGQNVRVYDLQGTQIMIWPWPYDLAFVRFVAVAPDGDVYITDTSGDVGHWTVVGTIGLPLAYINPAHSANGIAVDAAGLVYVSVRDQIEVFTSTFAPVGQWGSQGLGEGQFVGHPWDVAINGGIVYVCDFQACQVLEFAEAATPTVHQSWGELKRRFH